MSAFLYEGSYISSRDIRYVISQYKNDASQKTLISDLQAALNKNPQATMFVTGNGNKVTPVDYQPNPPVPRTVKGDLVIVGGELCSLTTAVQAAERGLHVVVLYAGPLGGMSSDTGGNLRYFDVQNSTSHPVGQQKIWHEALGVKAWVTIPPDTDQKLSAYLAKNYSGKIELVPTKSYDGLWVTKSGDAIQSIETPEGVAVTGPTFIDSDPEARVAEKAGVPYELDTPHMSDGMTFDVLHLSENAFNAISTDDQVQPEKIEKLVGVTADQVKADPYALKILEKLKVNIDTDFFVTGSTHAYGYCGLAMGFGFYMACRAIKNPSDDLKWLNGRRYVSGFNIARFGDQGSFNSISYQFMKNYQQHSHSLETEAEFAPIKRTEIPALQAYLRYVADDQSLEVRMPPQFYIRTASAFFKLNQPYEASEMNAPKSAPYYTRYPMDLRDLFARDAASWRVVYDRVKKAKGKNFWNARATAAQTTVPNLYLVNKCSVTPTYFGGQRTEQSAINLGAAVVDSLGK